LNIERGAFFLARRSDCSRLGNRLSVQMESVVSVEGERY
jgi:hypothetical protein